jgi:hypothetical protein
LLSRTVRSDVGRKASLLMGVSFVLPVEYQRVIRANSLHQQKDRSYVIPGFIGYGEEECRNHCQG